MKNTPNKNIENDFPKEHLPLLKSLAKGRKYLCMGRSPVQAIALAWQWQSEGLCFTDSEGYVNITDKSRQVLADNK